jgi:nucleobase:cation symporter-1, NCS1 family
MADIARYARSPRKVVITQAIALPVVITLTELLGTVMAASSQVLYGSILWNPLDVVIRWDNRAAKFFAGLFFAFANIGTNVTGNSIPFANDLTGMFPKYINIRRGQFICAFLGFAICPWQIEAKAQRFLAFLGGYTVFLGPLLGGNHFASRSQSLQFILTPFAAVLMSDFWIVRKGRGYNVYNLYKPGGIYWYFAGINPRAMVAFIVGMTPLLPGLAFNINPQIGGISQGILNFYTLAWFDGMVFSA